jgi:hypothetical protein
MRPRGINNRRLLANLLYSNSQCLDVIVAGKIIRQDGETLTLDEQNISLQLEAAVAEYYDGINPPQGGLK